MTIEDAGPTVMRSLEVPLKIRLDRLHLMLQTATGLTNSHLYEFTAGGTSWGVPETDFGDARPRTWAYLQVLRSCARDAIGAGLG